MLARNWHRHIAKKRFPALRENRFLWFANDDDNQPQNPEREHGVPEQPEMPEQSTGAIDELTRRTRSGVESVRPLVAKQAAQSQFVYATTIDILKKRELTDLPGAKELISEGKGYLKTFDALQDETLSSADKEALELRLAERQEKIEQLLQSALESPQIALAVAEAFEQRAKRYDELKNKLGDVSPKALTQFEAKLKAENPQKRDLFANHEFWEEAEIDEALTELNIDPNVNISEERATDGAEGEVERAIRAALGTAEEETEENDAPKKRKLRLLRRHLTAARQLAIMEKNDLGSETTLENASDIEQPLAEQVLNARKNLEQTLLARGKRIATGWDTFRKDQEEKYDTTDITVIASNLSVSELALYHRYNEVQSTIDSINRNATLRDTGAPSLENLPKASDPSFIDRATVLTHELSELEWLESDNVETAEKRLISDLVAERKGAEAWAQKNADTLAVAASHMRRNPELLSNIGELISDGETDPEQVQGFMDGIEHHATVARRVYEGNATAEDLDHLHDNLPTAKRNYLDMVLLAMSSPAFMRQLRRDKRLIGRDEAVNSEDVRNAVLNEVAAAETSLLQSEALGHYVASALPIEEELKNTIAKVRSDTRVAARMKGEKANELLRACRLTAAKLTKAAQELNELSDNTQRRVRSVAPENLQTYLNAGGLKDTTACYNRRDGVIYLNEQAIAQQAAAQNKSADVIRNEAIYHEQGHAVVDVLMNRVGVLPALMLKLHKTLQEPVPNDPGGKTFNDLLMERAKDWGITDDVRAEVLKHEHAKLETSGIRDKQTLQKHANRNTEQYIHEMLMDELANKFAEWKHTGSNEGFSAKDLDLLRLLDGDGTPPNISFDTEALSELPAPDIALQQSRASDDPADIYGDNTTESTDSGIVTAPMIGQRIFETQNQFLLINEFIKNHQKVHGVEEFTGWVKTWEDFFEQKVKNPFYDNSSNRASEAEILRLLSVVEEDFIKDATEQMEEVTRQQMEADAGQSGGGLLNMFRGMELASINDVIGMFKSMGEDIQRMWKRRSERVQSVLGENITGWIPDNNIWGLRYAGQLKHEFSRRSSASEIEEVKQWKDALDDLDSYALEEILGTSKNKDQVRGIVELLIDRGRLDFNNVKFWHTLSHISGMNMPFDACKNNSVLRDKWLQNMVTAIWDDKDKFFEWRQSNDSGIESGKKKFTQVADQLSNLSGGLAKKLESQLKLWVGAKKSGQSPPDEVNPHLYEEVLHYAMRNGKMSMEQKLYYLVQGTRYGLISIDRLQALAGENGGVLNIFPFIDYFYGKNNTWPEINALGERLQESKTGDGQFTPGPKTTLWLHMELLRNESARQRISKATSGTRAENIDHEDIPTIVAQADYKTIERLTDIVSGSREKLSPEATKNTYTGFGTKFKILARMAELDDTGDARFTEADALEAGKAIASYIHMDNIFTRNGIDNPRRSEISWAEFETQAPSSSGLKVSAYRNANNDFVRDLLGSLGDAIDWNKMNTTAGEFIRASNDTNAVSEEDQKKNFKATGIFAQEIARALSDPRNREVLKKVLKAHVNAFKEENYNNKITKKMLESYVETKRNYQ